MQHSKSMNTAPLRLIGGVVVGLMMVALASTASADEVAQLKEKVEVYKLKLADLRTQDKHNAVTQDIARADLWIGEAQAQLAKEEEDVAAHYLRRVEVSLEMIVRLIDQSKTENLAYERESAALAMEKDANQAKILLEQSELKERQLSKEIDGLRTTADGMKNGTKTPAGNGNGTVVPANNTQGGVR